MRSSSTLARFASLACLCSMLACSNGNSTTTPPTPEDDTGIGGDDTSTTDSSSDDTSTTTDTAAGDTSKPPTDTATPPPDVPPGGCTDDMQCAANEYCVYPGGTCKALPSGKCTGSSASACGGYAPKCKDYSCFQSGDCGGKDSNCHAGEKCVAKAGMTLCVPTSPCAETVTAADVANGKYAPGKEVCIKDYAREVLAEVDGDYHVRMAKFTTAVFGTCPLPVVPPGLGLVTELTPEYQKAGLTTPKVGSTVTVQGTVRWDGAHCWWEIHPVKYFGP